MTDPTGNLPQFLNEKREMLGLLRDLEVLLNELREHRIDQILRENCPVDTLKFNAGFIAGLDTMSDFVKEKLNTIKTKE